MPDVLICNLCRTRYLPKENITFQDQTVNFMLPLGAIFEPSMSVGPEEDVVTTLDLFVAVSVTSSARQFLT